jgi:hypothetical protein
MSSYWEIIKFTDWNTFSPFSHVGIFDLALWPFVLLTFSLVHPLPFLKSKYNIYRQFVAGRGLGVLNCVGDHIMQEVSEPIQITLPFQTKT